MIAKLLQFVRFVLKDHSGQILPWIAVAFVAAIGVTGLSVDMGHAYIVQRQMQTCGDAGALAGAQVLPQDPIAQATKYSCSPSGNNYSPAIPPVTTHVQGKCLNSLINKGVPCLVPSGWNAVQVTQTANVPTMFMRALDFLPGVHLDTIPVSATATAGRTKPIPVNVAIILDMTGSLDYPELNDPTCIGHQEFQCQLYAVQAMLQALDPCGDGSKGSSCDAALSNVRVGLFMFPNISADAATLSNQINCGAGGAAYPLQNNQVNDPSNPYALTKIVPEPYTFPIIGAADYSTAGLTYSYTAPAGKNAVTPPPISATYQVVKFSSDYWDPDQAYKLNPNSDLVKAVGQGGGAVQGCLNFPSGIVNSNVNNTYLASSIYAAQAALIGEQARHTKRSTNSIVFISDGKSNVSSAFNDPKNQMVSTSGGSMRNQTADSGKPLYQAAPGVWPVFGTVSSGTGLTALTNTGHYPDSKDQCQQAVMAGVYAHSMGTTVTSVANGAPGGGGCLDASLVATGTLNVPMASVADVTSCNTMKDIASPIQTDTATSLGNFYSTTNQGCKDLDTTDHGAAGDLLSIFKSLSFGFVRATLIPNSAN